MVTAPGKPLIVLVGPTASGKTALALNLAENFNGEIISCDSVAVYREMEIGTAKPSHEERALVPHHMIDIAWPDEACTAGDYSRQAREALTGITERNHLNGEVQGAAQKDSAVAAAPQPAKGKATSQATAGNGAPAAAALTAVSETK